jgi:hypothetical protein
VSWITSVANYLTSNSYGTQGTNLFIGQMPDTTSLTTVLTEYDGGVIETNGSGIALYQPSLQVRVRGATEDYTTPRARIVAVQTLLSGVTGNTLSGVTFLRIKPLGSIISLGQDDRLRWEFTANFEVTIAEG